MLHLIDRLYAAAEAPQAWPEFLDDLSDALGSKMTALFHQDVRRRSASVAVLRRADPDYIRPYEEYYAARNPFFAAPVATGDVFDDTIVADDVLLRSEYYNDWMKPQDARYGAAIVAFNEAGVLSILSTWRGHRAPRVSTEELQLLHVLRPHLQRALQIHRTLSAAEERATVANDALDLVPVGVIVLDGRGRVVRMNRAAEGWSARRDGFFVAHGEVEIVAHDAARRFREVLAGALRDGFDAGGALVVPRESGRPFHFIVAPMRAQRGVAILISGGPVASLDEPLAALYGLTAAEARVASELLGGAGIDAAAASLKVSAHTVRTHVKHIYAKTGTERQAELVALLTPLVARPKEDS